MIRTLVIVVLATALLGRVRAQDAKILEIENIVQTAAATDPAWTQASKDQTLSIRDRIRTRQRSRATVRLTNLYTMRLEQLTTVEITPQLVDVVKPQLDLMGGALFIFSREQNGEIDIRTPAANGALRGTQLFVQVAASGRTYYQVLEGSVELSNPQGRLLIHSGEAAEAVPGSAPKKTAALEARNILQWALYYPAVLDPDELESTLSTGHEGEGDTSAQRPASDRSIPALKAYRDGDLLEALKQFHPLQTPGAGGPCFHAALLLAVGRVDEARAQLAGVPPSNSMRRSLERLIATARFEPQPEWRMENLTTASEAMAESYYLQSRARLEDAMQAARRATELSPQNGYAWVRLAELEFSFGRPAQAQQSLKRGLELAPLNAQAHALHGFILSALNDIKDARAAFEHAVELDGALGNGWLGLGLTKIKQGEVSAGRADVQTAATVEPLVSMFHSYLGKALSVEGRIVEAQKDLILARQLDPNDPTPWLYSAIESQLHNRTNEAIGELQESMRLNENRRIYRSEFLLDQDRAVRSANLARIYLNNGMNAVALREAARAVDNDYTNASAHLFLSNAFNALRDPKRVALRYETPWFNELLLSNLFSPVGGGPLSQYVTQQEYSKLLEADGMGMSVTNEYRDTGEFRSSASVFGNYGNVSFGLDYSLRKANGYRYNNRDDLQEIYGQLKWQPTPDDILYFLGKVSQQTSGDTFDTYNNQPLAPHMHFKESQQPGLLLAGWNHRWAPGSNTLFLAGRLAADQVLTNPVANQLLVQRDTTGLSPGLIADALLPANISSPDGISNVYSPALSNVIQPYLGSGNVTGVNTVPFSFATQRQFEIYSAELQHIQQVKRHSVLAGARFQTGTFETNAQMSAIQPAASFFGGFASPTVDQHSEVNFQRLSLYAYDYWQPASWITLIGGVAWDRIHHPDNFRNPPVNNNQRQDERISGKAGLILKPSRWFTIRSAYTQGLGGVSFDESVRLEPVQIAGFNQSYRTIISESLAGSVETPRFQSGGLSFEGSLPSRTWWGLTGNVIQQDVSRTIGSFVGYDIGGAIQPAYFPTSTPQRLSYLEQSLQATLNQLVGSEFALGTVYRVTQSELHTTYPDLLASGAPGTDVKNAATLHELGLSLNWNSPSGFFARFESNWFMQTLRDDPRGLAPGAAPRTGDNFWQFNAFTGYRFNRNFCEVSAGVLNITDQDYRLSPMSPYYDIARQQTFVLRCRFSF